MADERPAKRRRFTGDLVTIKVGTDETEVFTAHADLLKEYSSFFKAALDKKWKEGQALHLNLPEDEADTIEAYLRWLHGGVVEAPPSPGDDDLTFVLLAKLYVFGEKVQDDHFCNSVVDTMALTLDQPDWANDSGPSVDAIKILYEGSSEGSPVRQLFVQYYVGSTRFRKEELPNWPVEFMQDMLVECGKRLSYSGHELLFSQKETWYKQI